jgi:hypothetical protein
MATIEDIEALKGKWISDPCWTLEETEGFEEHRAELCSFRMETEKHWQLEHQTRMAKKAEELGVPGNARLAEYLDGLEQRIMKLEHSSIGTE